MGESVVGLENLSSDRFFPSIAILFRFLSEGVGKLSESVVELEHLGESVVVAVKIWARV